MPVHYSLRKILLCTVLQLGALMGAPLLPERIDDLIPATVQTVTEESTTDDAAAENALVLQAWAHRNSLEACRQTESEGQSL